MIKQYGISSIKDKLSDLDKHIEGLLELGYRISEIMEMLKVEDQQIVDVLDRFAKEETNKIKFNEIMERLGYEYEKV